jgi:hypothetical protein
MLSAKYCVKNRFFRSKKEIIISFCLVWKNKSLQIIPLKSTVDHLIKFEIATYLSQGSKLLFLLVKSYPIECIIQQLLNLESEWLLFTTDKTCFEL